MKSNCSHLSVSPKAKKQRLSQPDGDSVEVMLSKTQESQLRFIKRTLGLDKQSKPQRVGKHESIPKSLFELEDRGANQKVWVNEVEKTVVKLSRRALLCVACLELSQNWYDAFCRGDQSESFRQELEERYKELLDLAINSKANLGCFARRCREKLSDEKTAKGMFLRVGQSLQKELASQNNFVHHDAEMQLMIFSLSGDDRLSRYQPDIRKCSLLTIEGREVVIEAAFYPLLDGGKPISDLEIFNSLKLLLEKKGRLFLDIVLPNFSRDSKEMVHSIDPDPLINYSSSWSKNRLHLPSRGRPDDGYESDESVSEKRSLLSTKAAHWRLVMRGLSSKDLLPLSVSWLRLALAYLLENQGNPPCEVVDDLLKLNTLDEIKGRFLHPDDDGALGSHLFFSLREPKLSSSLKRVAP